MKSRLSLVSVALMALCGITSAQTTNNPPPLPPVATNGVSGFLTDVVDWFKNGTNFIAGVDGIVTTGNNGKYGAGGGIFVAYQVSQYFESGLRMDYLNHTFYQGSFTGQLQVPVTLFGKVTVVPFILGGVAVPFGGGAADPGSVQGIAGTGLAVRLSSKVDLLADVEKWSATSGQQFRFGIGYKF